MEARAPLREDLERILNQWLGAPELRSEVRGYLRHRLFTALHNSRVGGGLGRLDAQQQPVSPKVQTLNLLIAEYLLKQRHHFTLSVFSCEAPNVACVSPGLPEVLRASGCSVHVFGRQELDDVLDALGLPHQAHLVQRLKSQYEDEKHEALLTCILRNLPAFFSAEKPIPEPKEVPKVDQVDSKNNDEEMEKIKRHYQEELELLTEQCRQEIAAREDTIRKLKSQMDSSYAIQQTGLAEVLEERIKEMEAHIKHYEAVKDKEIVSLKKLNRSLEDELSETRGTLEARKKKLRDEEFRIEQEKVAIRREKKKLQKHQRQLDEVSVALTEHFPDPSSLELQLQIKDQELVELRNKYLTAQDENKSLQTLTEQQRSRIESLNDRVTNLALELQFHKDRVGRSRQQQSLASENDSSPTEEVIKDARRRIKSLEEEFEAIEKSHQDFRNRSLDESLFPARTPPIFHQTPPTRVAAPRPSSLVGDIQTSIKSIYESIQPQPEKLQSPRRLRFQPPRVNLLDASASSISLESTGIEPLRKPISAEAGPSGFPGQLNESISPILTETIVIAKPILPQAPEQIVSSKPPPPPAQVETSPGSPIRQASSPELSEVKFNIEPDALATSDELKLTIPSSSSGDSSNIIEATRLETTVAEKVMGGVFKSSSASFMKLKAGRTDGDGMVESSTSEDRSEHAIFTSAKNDDNDDFWDL